MAIESTGINKEYLISQQNAAKANASKPNTEPNNSVFGTEIISGSSDAYNAASEKMKQLTTARMTAQVSSMLAMLVNDVTQLANDNTSAALTKSFQDRLQTIQKVAGNDINVSDIMQNLIKNLTDKNKAKIEQVLGIKEEDNTQYTYAPLDNFQANVFSKLPQFVQDTAVQASNAANTSVSDKSIGTIKTSENGNKLANIANQTGKTLATKGWCLKGVNDSLQKMYGFRLGFGSAYMAADALAKKTDLFTETHVAKKDLEKLPAGAIVVWNKDGDSPHGHISVSLGNGYESSDHISKQYKNISDSYRIFIPN